MDEQTARRAWIEAEDAYSQHRDMYFADLDADASSVPVLTDAALAELARLRQAAQTAQSAYEQARKLT